MNKIFAQYENLKAAQLKFVEALSFPDTEPMRESLIQRFEYTYELSWKLMSGILRAEDIDAYGPRNVIREAARVGMIRSAEEWLEFAFARNKTTHIYKEAVAKEVAKQVRKEFAELTEKLVKYAEDYVKSHVSQLELSGSE